MIPLFVCLHFIPTTTCICLIDPGYLPAVWKPFYAKFCIRRTK